MAAIGDDATRSPCGGFRVWEGCQVQDVAGWLTLCSGLGCGCWSAAAAHTPVAGASSQIDTPGSRGRNTSATKALPTSRQRCRCHCFCAAVRRCHTTYKHVQAVFVRNWWCVCSVLELQHAVACHPADQVRNLRAGPRTVRLWQSVPTCCRP
jgi:hypothetical protein